MTTRNQPAALTTRHRRWQRLTFPLGDGDSTAEQIARRDRVVDAAFIAGSALFGGFFLAASWAQHDQALAAVDIALGVACCTALLARRQHPATVAAFAVAASAVAAAASGAALVALFSAAIRLRARTVAALAVAELLATAVFPLLYSNAHALDYAQQIVIGGLINLVAVAWGLLVGLQRRYLTTVLQHADLIRVEQQLQATAARDAERRRIAREVHDVLTHRLSLLSVQAGALEFRTDLPAETTRRLAGVIRQTSHDALQELHSAIGALREGSEQPALHPQPGLSDLMSLVDQSRAAGTRVIVEKDIDAADVAERVHGLTSRTAYRVIQESLSNARKHAPESPVRITVGPDSAGQLRVTVRTRLSDDAAPSRTHIPGSGTGLVGLAERVALAGGEISHGPIDDEFVVRATLPWSS